jgi:hypothetical protein
MGLVVARVYKLIGKLKVKVMCNPIHLSRRSSVLPARQATQTWLNGTGRLCNLVMKATSG